MTEMFQLMQWTESTQEKNFKYNFRKQNDKGVKGEEFWGYREYDNPVEELDQFLLILCVSASRLYKNPPLYVWKYVEATGEKQELNLHPLSESYLQHTFLLPTFYTYPRQSILCLHPLSPVTFLLPSPCFSGMTNWLFCV